MKKQSSPNSMTENGIFHMYWKHIENTEGKKEKEDQQEQY
jgi:hypothetical protein